MWYFGVPKISKSQLLTCSFSNSSAEEGPGILVRGLYLVGAEWDAEKLVLKEASRESIFQQMPVIRLVPVHNGNCIIQDIHPPVDLYLISEKINLENSVLTN